MTDQERKTRNDGSLSLRVDLNPEVTAVLFKIMDERKFQYYAEAIRYCIVETNNQTEFKLSEGYWKKISKFLNYPHVKVKERIYNVQDFVNKAIDEYIKKIERENQSIMNFDVRRDLQGEELNLAMAFIECQEENTAQQVTVEALANKMGKRNYEGIKEVLESFIERGILDKLVHEGKLYYHAKPVEKF